MQMYLNYDFHIMKSDNSDLAGTFQRNINIQNRQMQMYVNLF